MRYKLFGMKQERILAGTVVTLFSLVVSIGVQTDPKTQPQPFGDTVELDIERMADGTEDAEKLTVSVTFLAQ